MMLALQNEPVDMLMYYDGQANSSYCGLYDPVNRRIFKAYFAFEYFNEAFKLKNQLAIEIDDDDFYAISATDGDSSVVVFANISDKRKEITVDGLGEVKEIRLTDEDKYNESVAPNNTFVVEPYAVAYVKF
jgi:hypothetical protein